MFSPTRCKRAAALAALTLLGVAVGATPSSAADIRSQEWFLTRLHAEQAWNITRGGGVTVAVIDSGVEATHPDLRGQVLAGTDVGDGTSPKGWVDTDTKFNGHGTAMASLIAGTGANGGGQGMMGLAPVAKILPIHDNVSADIPPLTVGEGIEYAIQHGASVINISSASTSDGPVLRKAVRDAIAHNVVVVAGMGNDAQRGNTTQFPAAEPGVVAVGATDQSGQAADFSQSAPFIALAAPGTNIVTAASHAGYAQGEGTSESTALVSAAAALVRAHFPKLTAGQVINRLIKTADHPAGGRDDHVGYGIVNPYKALTADIPAGPPGNPLLQTTPSQPSATITAHTIPSASPTARPASKGDNILLVAGITVACLVAIATVCLIIFGRRRNRYPPPY